MKKQAQAKTRPKPQLADYHPNHPAVLKHDKVRTALKDFVRQNKEILLEACSGTKDNESDPLTAD